MKRLLLTCALLAGALIPALCFSTPPPPAQTEVPAISPSALPAYTAPRKGDPFELQRLELQMAESGYQFNASNATLSRVIAALEALAGPICMPNLLSTLEYAGKPADPECLTLMTRLLELESRNPLAICIRDGIFSKTCKSAYDDLIVESFIAYSANPGDDGSDAGQMQLTFKLAESSAKEAVRNYELELQKISGAAPQGTPGISDAQRARSIKHLKYRMLKSACEVFRVRLDTPDRKLTGQRFSIPRPTPTRVVKTFKDTMLNSLEKLKKDHPTKAAPSLPSPGATPRAQKLQHIRFITSTCSQTVSKLLYGADALPAAKCYAIGTYSPDCIRALIEERAVASAQPVNGEVKQAPGAQPAVPLFEEF